MNEEKERIRRNLAIIRQRMSSAAERSGRSLSDVQLVAVSKKQDCERIRALQEVLQDDGAALILGENQVQEFKKKRPMLVGEFRAHMIGTLQSNKVRDAVRLFDMIESIHDERIAALVDSEAGRAGKVQPILLQVNISDDAAKSGFSVAGVEQFMRETLPGLKNLDCAGLMTITRYYERREDVRPDFRRMRELKDRLLEMGLPSGGNGQKRIEISMGMSEDYDLAIEEGATFVRIGTALFGERNHA